MSVRAVLAMFLALAAFGGAAIYGSAAWIVRRSVFLDDLASEIRRARESGESDFAQRLLIKGAFYSKNPETLIRTVSDDPQLEAYLRAIVALRPDRPKGWPDPEAELRKAADGPSPLLAARAAIRLEQIRYKTAIPNAERIPF